MPRIAPAEPPYEPAIAAELARIMPPGVPPLVLFRTMAKSPRIFAKMFAGGLLDKGPLGLRQREIVIDRTTARLGCAYEWGVHVAFFADKAGSTSEQVAATVTEDRDAPCWTPAEQALIALVDDLVDAVQILETIALAGYYHAISFLCLALELPLESYAARFPAVPSAD